MKGQRYIYMYKKEQKIDIFYKFLCDNNIYKFLYDNNIYKFLYDNNIYKFLYR